jgi:hypothetical protein
MSDAYTLPDGTECGTGLNAPAEFPTSFPKFADAPGVRVLKLDQIKATLAGKKSLFNRRHLFGGDWISNQRSTNACNGHSTARTLSRAHYLRTGDKVLLSGADAYSQMNGGRDSGSTLGDAMKVVQNGVATEETVPWNLIFSRQIPAAALEERKRFRGFEVYAVDEEEELATGLLMGFVGIVGVHVTRSYHQQDSDGVCRGGNGPGNHSVGVQDLRLLNGRILYDQPNSWGNGWGDGGFTWLEWDRQLRECVRYHRYWLLRSTLDDPKGDNPPASQED